MQILITLLFLISICFLAYQVYDIRKIITATDSDSPSNSSPTLPITTTSTLTKSNPVNVASSTITNTSTSISKTHTLVTYTFTITPSVKSALTTITTTGPSDGSVINLLGACGTSANQTLQVFNIAPFIQSGSFTLQFMANDITAHTLSVSMLVSAA